MPHPLVYEINTRCWLRELSGQHATPITLANVPDAEFEPWSRWGLTHIWLMGVWIGGPRARAEALADPRQRTVYAEALPDWTEADVEASPYAIADYAVPDQLGGEKGLARFRERLHGRGLKLILDFVPNHLGLDHRWVRERPELFVQQAGNPSDSSRQGSSGSRAAFVQETVAGPRWLAHGKDPYFSPWTDTVQLDYRRTDTREAMAGLLEAVARRCDGVRCDMAMLLLNDVFAKTWAETPMVAQPSPAASSGTVPVPEPGTVGGTPPQLASAGTSVASTTEFWSTAITRIKTEFPEFLFLAEAYWGTEIRLQELGFDYTYDKTLYDRVIAQDAAAVQQHLLGLAPPRLAGGAHFLENHDEPRVASLLSPAQHRPAALVILALPGLRLLHEGQLTGARRRLPVQLRRRASEPADPEITRMYEQLLGAIDQSWVGSGQFELLNPRAAWPGNPTAQNFILVRWQAQAPGFDLVVVNLAANRSQCYAPLTGMAPHGLWSLKDRLGPEQYLRSGEELEKSGLYLDLPPHGAQIFEFTVT